MDEKLLKAQHLATLDQSMETAKDFIKNACNEEVIEILNHLCDPVTKGQAIVDFMNDDDVDAKTKKDFMWTIGNLAVLGLAHTLIAMDEEEE